MTYEKAIQALQQLVNELESEAVSIDDLTAKVAEATKLIQFCKSKLHKVETEVKEMIRDI